MFTNLIPPKRTIINFFLLICPVIFVFFKISLGQTQSNISSDTIIQFGAIVYFVTAVILAPLVEEIVFRGFLSKNRTISFASKLSLV